MTNTTFPVSLRNVLRFPLWWHPYHFTVRRVIPADQKTAEALLLLRVMDELRRVAGRAENEAIDLAAWWADFQERATRDWPAELNQCRVDLPTMLGEASRSPDGQVVEFVSEYL